MNFIKIKEDLKKSLSTYRYEHSIRVAEEAKKLAKHYGENEYDAYLAGLLHDIAKEFSDDKIKHYLKKYNLSNDLLDKENRRVSHAIIGALVARELYNINDSIYNAIKYHTIANKDMNILEKMLFIADKIECGKDYPGIEEERVLAYQNIDEALVLCLINTKKKLEKEGRRLSEESVEVLNFFQNKI